MRAWGLEVVGVRLVGGREMGFPEVHAGSVRRGWCGARAGRRSAGSLRTGAGSVGEIGAQGGEVWRLAVARCGAAVPGAAGRGRMHDADAGGVAPPGIPHPPKEIARIAFHGLRSLADSLAAPVATCLRPHWGRRARRSEDGPSWHGRPRAFNATKTQRGIISHRQNALQFM